MARRVVVKPVPLRTWERAASSRPLTRRRGSRVIAHQGGLDELAFVAVPLAVLALLLWLAARRAAREADKEAGQEHGDGPAGPLNAP